MDSWDAYASANDIEVRPQDLMRYYLAFGLAAHVHRLGCAVFLVLDADLALEATPMIRTMFECAVTAQWVYQVPGAAEAFLNKQEWERTRVLANLPGLGVATLSEASIAAAKKATDEFERFETNAAASFKAICDDLEPGGTSAYVNYQLMCGTSHPSTQLVDTYFVETSTYPGLGRRATPVKSSRDGWAGIATGSLVWAGQAVAYGDLLGRRQVDLDQVSSWLGIEAKLQPSDIAMRRAAPPSAGFMS